MSTASAHRYKGEVPAIASHYSWDDLSNGPVFYLQQGDDWQQWSTATGRWSHVNMSAGIANWLLPISRLSIIARPAPEQVPDLLTCTRITIGGVEWGPVQRVVVTMPDRTDPKYWDECPEEDPRCFAYNRYLQDVEQAIRDSGAEVIK